MQKKTSYLVPDKSISARTLRKLSADRIERFSKQVYY